MSFVSDALKCSMFVMVAVLIVNVMLTRVISDNVIHPRVIDEKFDYEHDVKSKLREIPHETAQKSEEMVKATKVEKDELYEFVHATSQPPKVRKDPPKVGSSIQDEGGIMAANSSVGMTFADSFEAWTS